MESLKGIGLGIITNGASDRQRAKLELTDLVHYFEVVVVGEDVGAWKPDSRIFELAAQLGSCGMADCWYVGDDYERDALAASRAGMKGVWLDRFVAEHQSEVPVCRDLKRFAELVAG